MIDDGREERDLGGGRVADPVEGADGDAERREQEDDPPPHGRRSRAGDDLGQTPLEGLQVLAGHLLHRWHAGLRNS